MVMDKIVPLSHAVAELVQDGQLAKAFAYAAKALLGEAG